MSCNRTVIIWLKSAGHNESLHVKQKFSYDIGYDVVSTTKQHRIEFQLADIIYLQVTIQINFVIAQCPVIFSISNEETSRSPNPPKRHILSNEKYPFRSIFFSPNSSRLALLLARDAPETSKMQRAMRSWAHSSLFIVYCLL